MNRRRLLALSGTLAGSLLAGCLGGGDSESNVGTQTRTETTTTTTATTATPSPTSTSTRRATTERGTDQPTTETTDSTGTSGNGTTRSAARSPTTTEGPTVTEGAGIVDRQFTVTDRTCGNPTNEGTISFEDGQITLTGTITGSDGCVTALIEDLTYDRGADRLRVLVGTERESNGGAICTQCLTEIDYEASVAVENGPPATVVLVHHTNSGERRVATASP